MVSNFGADVLLAAGPEKLLQYLDRCPTYSPKADDYLNQDTIYIDVEKKHIRGTVGFGSSVDYQLEKYLQSVWTGWDLVGHYADLSEHWRLSGREPFIKSPTITNKLSWMRDCVIEESSFDPKEFVKFLESKGEAVGITNPYFFETYEILLDEDRKKRFFHDVMKKWKRQKGANSTV